MDRNREAWRVAAMANGLHRRRHRTTTNPGSLRDSPEEEGQGPMELQEAARFRDRTARKERDRERDRDRDRVREKDRERLSRSKRRRGDKYLHGSNSVREDGTGGGIEDSSEESVNDDEDDYDDGGPIDYAPPSNLLRVSTSLAASSLTSQRKSYPPPSKVYRVTPTLKASDEMIGVSVPRKARSASTKRAHECWSSGVGSDHINRMESSSAARLSTATTTGVSSPAVIPHPLSPSSSTISMKKKFKPNGAKHRPPKPSVSKSSSSFQDEIEIEVAEVLYGLMRQSQPPGPSSLKQESLLNDSATVNATVTRSSEDSKSGLSSTILRNQNSRSSAPLTVVAPIRKRPRLCPDENPKAGRSSPVLSKSEMESSLKQEAPSPNTEKNDPSTTENGGPPSTILMMANDILPDKMVEEISVGGRNRVLRSTTKIEEDVSSLPKLDSSQTYHRVESSFTSTKPNTTFVEKENRRGDKFEIDLMSPASPEKEEEIGEYGGNGDEKTKETKSKPYEVENLKSVKDNSRIGSVGGAPVNRVAEAAVSGDESKAADLSTGSQQHKATMLRSLLSLPPQLQHQRINSNGKERSVGNNSDNKLNFQQHKQKQQLPKVFTREDSHSDKHGGQSSSVALPMSVPAGWHGGGLAPMGYVGPLQGVVSMDGTTMASPPIQTPPSDFRFSQQKPKRCATHCYIAGSICIHQRLLKMNTFWSAPANATAPLFGAKGPSYNLNMVPSADIHSGRGGGVISASQEGRGQPFAFFPGQPPPASSKDTFSQAPASDPSPNKQFLLQPGLPPPAAGNMMHAPALFFPMGQQQAATSVRPGSGKNTSTASTAASTSTFPSSPVAAAVPNASPAGPAMSFSYGNETPFMAILGNGHYPFPIPAHVGAAPPYRGPHPQPMSFFNGSFYSSQMLHPSQLQQPQSGQNPQNANISTATSSSQKQLQQSQQQRPPGINANNVGNPNQNQNQNSILQNFQPIKGREMGGEDNPSTADSRNRSNWSNYGREMGGEDNPSTADSRNRSNWSIYGQNFVMPFNSPNFALMPSSLGGGVPNGNHGDKKQQQQQQQSQQSTLSPAFPMSFPTINGGTAPGLDISSMSHNHAFLQSLPEAAKQSYHMMAAAQAAQLGKTKYRGLEDGKNGAAAATDPSSLDEERRIMAARASASSSGQSIAFSRDLAENNVVDSSARSLNLGSGHGSIRPARSSGPHSVSNSPSSQQPSQMLFPKQQQYTPPAAASARSKTPSMYPDHLNSSPIMAAKFPSTLSGFPSLVQASVGPTQSQWKNSVRPNTSQSQTPSPSATTQSSMKTPPQQQGRPQQTHTQISFGPAVTNSNLSTASQGQQSLDISQAPSSPMMVGSPSNSSISKSAGGSPRTGASNKSVGQGSTTLSSQQGKNSTSPSLSTHKSSILGSPHMMSTSGPAAKPQNQQPQLSKQSNQQAQLYFTNYVQANTSAAMAGAGYYLQRHRPDNQQQQQQQQQGSKSQGSIPPPTSSSGMFSVAAQFAAQSAVGQHQLMPLPFPYVHAVSTAAPVKPAEQKQPAGE